MMRALPCAGLLVLLAGAVALVSGCPDKKPKYPLCGSDKDCKDGEHCVNKQCQQCGEDSHCPAGQTCQNGSCVKREGKPCSSDADCPDEQTCKDGVCSACEADSECGPGGKCNAGVCARPKACDKDEDCEDDEDCLEGRCQKPWEGSTPSSVSCTLDTIYFDFDRADVTDESRATLSEDASCIKSAPADRGVYIIGHTDTSGTEEYNIALSERRAQVVADYLARLGIDPARMGLIPKGESEPTGKGDGLDRRVEFEWR